MTLARTDAWMAYLPPRPMQLGWAADQLAVGSMPLTKSDVNLLDAHDITHVLNVADDRIGHRLPSLLSGRGIAYRNVPFADFGHIPPDWWWEDATDWALDAIDAGGSVYVHCLVGSARGPSMAYAILRRQGWSHETARYAVQRARPEASMFYVADARDWLGDYERTGWTSR